MKKAKAILDKVVDVILAYKPKLRTKQAKRRRRKQLRRQRESCI